MQSSVNSATQKAHTFTSQVAELSEKPRVTINLMDVTFLEQNLSQILEVRSLSLILWVGLVKQSKCCHLVRGLVGSD